MLIQKIKSFVDTNRKITKFFVNICSEKFGEIDKSEETFYRILSGSVYDCVIEIGGANRPLFKKQDLKHYIGIDIDKSFEWELIYTEYYSQSCELSLPEIVHGNLVVSKYVLEHVPDNLRAFNNIKKMLALGGVSIHILPLGFHPFSMVNRILLIGICF